MEKIIKDKGHNGYISVRVTKGLYELRQAGRIAHDYLVQYLEPYGYHPSTKSPGIWMHDGLTINFTLVVNNFGVKY